MGEKINRKEFLKKFGILSLGSIFAMSKMGSMPAVKAAVSHNSDSEDISKDTIYTDSVSNVDVFTSGQSASDLAKAVNNISKSLHDETTERSSQFTSLSESFSKALAALKNTAVAKAIGVSGTTFPTVTAELSKIKDNKNWNKTITTPSKITIPAGYHNGNGFVDASSLKTPSGKKSITSNGTHDVTNYESVEVNVSPSLAGHLSYYKETGRLVPGDNGRITVPQGSWLLIVISANNESSPRMNYSGVTNVESGDATLTHVVYTHDDENSSCKVGVWVGEGGGSSVSVTCVDVRSASAVIHFTYRYVANAILFRVS